MQTRRDAVQRSATQCNATQCNAAEEAKEDEDGGGDGGGGGGVSRRGAAKRWRQTRRKRERNGDKHRHAPIHAAVSAPSRRHVGGCGGAGAYSYVAMNDGVGFDGVTCGDSAADMREGFKNFVG